LVAHDRMQILRLVVDRHAECDYIYCAVSRWLARPLSTAFRGTPVSPPSPRGWPDRTRGTCVARLTTSCHAGETARGTFTLRPSSVEELRRRCIAWSE